MIKLRLESLTKTFLFDKLRPPCENGLVGLPLPPGGSVKEGIDVLPPPLTRAASKGHMQAI